MTCLLLRKQFWMTFMIKFAASRSVMFGLNLCLQRQKEAFVGIGPKHSAMWGAHGHVAILETLSVLRIQGYIKRF